MKKLLKFIYVIIIFLALFLIYLLYVANSDSVMKIEVEGGRAEIFKSDDSQERIHGFSSSGQEEFEYLLVPKDKFSKGDYEIWLFYMEGDDKTKDELLEEVEALSIF